MASRHLGGVQSQCRDAAEGPGRMSDGSPGMKTGTVLEQCSALLWSQVQDNSSLHRSVEPVEQHTKRLCASGSCLCVHLVHAFMRLSTLEAGVCILGWGCGVQDEWQLPGAALLSKAEQMSEVPGDLTPSGVCKAHQLFAGATLLLRYHSFDSCCQSCHMALLRQILVCSTIGAHPMSCFA